MMSTGVSISTSLFEIGNPKKSAVSPVFPFLTTFKNQKTSPLLRSNEEKLENLKYLQGSVVRNP